MRWLAVLFVLSLAPACTKSADAEVEEAQTKKGKKDKGAQKKGGGKAGAQKKGGGKIGAQKKGGGKAGAQARGTQKKGAGKKGAGKKGEQAKGKRKPPVYGAEGPVVAELKLEEKTTGDKTRTSAKLALTAGEKEQTVRLGSVVGTCEEKDPVQVSDELTALWTVDCQTAKGKAEVSIAQQGDSLVVARAMDGSDEYKPLRKVRLADGAELKRK